METIHFKIGENAGKLLMQIAQEHLLYNYNPEKALATIEESLMGCQRDLTLKLIKGNMVLLVNEEEQVFYVRAREKEFNDFPFIDTKDWVQKNQLEINKTSEYLIEALENIQYKMKHDTIDISFTYKQVLKFVSDNQDFSILDYSEIEQLAEIIRITKRFIEKSLNIRKVIKILQNWYPSDFINVSIDNDGSLVEVIKNLKNVLSFDLSDVTDICDVTLNKYIESQKEITHIIDEGIKSVNILDNYSAGWLSPSGVFYGLNGEIANMLHEQIAEALQQATVIPTVDYYVNASEYLSQNGWVKIHGSNVQFEGCLNYRFSNHNIDITETQIKEIVKYINVCHNGIMKLGWKLEPISAARFEMTSNNLPFLYKTYFEF
jgi:hypothetical protein